MPKYFIDPKKYNTKFYRDLPKDYKLLWDYINAKCINGIWTVNFYLAEQQLGEDIEISESKARRLFKKNIATYRDKWLIKTFLDNQFGKLDPKRKRDKGIIKSIEEQGFNYLTLKPIQNDEETQQKELQREKTTKAKPKKEKVVNQQPVAKQPKPKKEPQPKEVIEGSGNLYTIEDLKAHYLNSERLVNRIIVAFGIDPEELEPRLDQFNRHLETLPRFQTTWEDYSSYFRNWHFHPKTPSLSVANSKVKEGEIHNGKEVAFVKDDGTIVYKGNTSAPTTTLK